MTGTNNNRVKARAAEKRYRDKNREKLRACWQERRRIKRAEWNAYQRSYIARRYRSDPSFRATRILRRRLLRALRRQGADKAGSTLGLVGCTSDFLRGYLEGQFSPGMTWSNIHIDHYIPCAAFDLTDPEQQKQCFHYSNLRPLLAVDNLKKGSKVPQH